MASAWRVTSAVTKGLPSRSPPIQLPMRRKDGISQSCQAASVAASSVLEVGIEDAAARAGRCSRSRTRPLATSSMTRRRVPRSMLVCHRISTARRSARRLAASSSGVNSTRSRSSSRRAISISRSIELLRRTSVGCAVSTGLHSAWRRSACSLLARQAGLAGALERIGHGARPRRGALAMAWARVRRMWCWSSAMLARCEK